MAGSFCYTQHQMSKAPLLTQTLRMAGQLEAAPSPTICSNITIVHLSNRSASQQSGSAAITSIKSDARHPTPRIHSALLLFLHSHSVSPLCLSDLAYQSADSFDHWVSVAVSVLQQNVNTPLHCTALCCIITTALTPIDSNSHLLWKDSMQPEL